MAFVFSFMASHGGGSCLGIVWERGSLATCVEERVIPAPGSCVE